MTNDPSKKTSNPVRHPDCVTKVRMGNTILTVSGYFKRDATDAAADKMEKSWKPRAAASRLPAHNLLSVHSR